ncbi:LacI family DNA-binding transcriptional regulator [Verrucomicrobiota bacterium sgz303538]
MSVPRQPTMQQIADAAGVSRMAVSLALRNSPKISRETTQRIREIAEKLGYRPNPMVAALMTQLRHGREVKRPSTIAYVTAYPTEDGWKRPGPFVAFREGARRRAEQLGYTLEEWWLRRPGMTEQRFCDILDTRNIHGLIIAPLPPGGGELCLDWKRFCMATIGYSVTAPDLHRASNHQYGTITLALQELTRRGYKRIGLALCMETDSRVNHHWSAGMMVYQQQIPEDQRVPPLLAEGPFGRHFAAWFSEHRPDVVLSHEWQVMRILDSLGLRVPHDVGFAHLALGDREQYQWAGMDQNSELVGAAAVDLVDAQLRHNERGAPEVAKTVLIPGRWISGPTVREYVAPALSSEEPDGVLATVG